LFQWCCKTACSESSESTNYQFETGSIASWDGVTTTSDLDLPGGCKVTSGVCTLFDGILIWNTTIFNDFCPFELKNRFTFKKYQKHIIIDELQGAFIIKGKFRPCANLINALVTDQGIILANFSDPFVPNSPITVDFGHPKDPVNAKLSYLHYTISRSEIYNFRLTWNEPCHHSQRYLDLIWQLLRYNPTIDARAYLQRSDIVADFTGEILTIWKCKQINVTKVYYNYKIGKICYKYLPVETNDSKIMFVTTWWNGSY